MLWKRREFVKTIVVERGVFFVVCGIFKMNIRVVERECGPAERGLFVTGLADSLLASS